MGGCELSLLISAVVWIVTVIGWFVTNSLTKKRESRKEVRETLDKIYDATEALLKSSHTYYCSKDPGEQEVSCCEIYASLEKINGLCSRLENDYKDIKLISKLDSLFEIITGGDFNSINLTRDSTVYINKSKEIALIAETIRREGDNWFNYTFKPK